MTKNDSYINSFKRIKDKLYANMNKKQHDDDFIPCCEEFTFIRWLDQLHFDNLMNKLKITHLVLDEEYDLSELLEHDLINPVHHEINTVLGLIGYTGTGKTWAVLRIIETIFNAYLEVKKKEIKCHICSNYNEFVKAVAESDIDDIIWCDELPLTTGTGTRIQLRQLENMLHMIRERRNTFLLIDPTRIKVDICYMYLKTAGINFKTGVSRFMLLNQEKEYFGHVYFYRPDVIPKEYKEKKSAQQIQIIDLRGKITAEFEDKKRKEGKEEDEEIIDGINYNRLKEVLALYESKNPERDVEIYLRHLKGMTFKKLGRIYNLLKPEYHYYKVEKFVKENLD